jgi:hypothetical protein
MGILGSFIFGSSTLGSGSSPPPQPNTRTAWRFQDYSGSQFYEFEINPLDVSDPAIKRTITTQATSAGRQVNYEGRLQPGTLTFSGTILSEGQYEVMNAWAQVRKQIKITDDLGRVFWVYIESFTPTRKYSIEFPWRMEYSVEATVLDWG